MKSLIHKARHFRSTGLNVVMALAFASLISGLSSSSALADNDNGRGQGARHGDHDQRASRGHHRGRHGHRAEYRTEYRTEYRQPYYYQQPVYVPPPVYYEEPRQSPGISLFFPLDLRR